MKPPPPLIVMNIAALSKGLLYSGGCPHLEAFARKYSARPLVPVLPALTLPMQATFLTGAPPGIHGIVGNGFFDRTWLEHRFWHASARLLDCPTLFQEKKGKVKTAALFWWNCLGGASDLYLNVAPIHTAAGETVSSCYSDPVEIYPTLEKKLGPFPLHRFWGPAVSIESSAWILAATMEIVDQYRPECILTYIPHLDYSLQRSGPDSEEVRRHLKELDDLLADPLDRALNGEIGLVILSEYGISPVRGAVSPNRVLKTKGLFRVRQVQGREYPDLPGSRAFAICDHQIAHVYVQNPADQRMAAEILADQAGVGSILDRDGKEAHNLNHARSGDLLALAEAGSWFDYSWWDDEGAAPDYAFTVDIHRKIGYDPLELLFDPKKKRIASNPGLIKGSHGLVPESAEELPVFIAPLINKDFDDQAHPLEAIRVKEELSNLLAGWLSAR